MNLKAIAILFLSSALFASDAGSSISNTTFATALSSIHSRMSAIEAKLVVPSASTTSIFSNLQESIKDKLIANDIDDDETLNHFSLDDLLNDPELKFSKGEKAKLAIAFNKVSKHTSTNETNMISRMKGQKLLDHIDEIVKASGKDRKDGMRLLKENFFPIDDLLQEDIDGRSLNSALQRLIDVTMRDDILHSDDDILLYTCGHFPNHHTYSRRSTAHEFNPGYTNWFGPASEIRCPRCGKTGCVSTSASPENNQCNILIYFIMTQLLSKGSDLQLLDQVSTRAPAVKDQNNLMRMQLFFQNKQNRDNMRGQSMREQGMTHEVLEKLTSDFANANPRSELANPKRALPWMD